MKKILLILSLFISINLSAQYTGPIPYPTSGYALPGTHSMAMLDFTNPAYILQDATILYPAGSTTSVPTVFFAHGFGGNLWAYHRHLFRFLVSHGYAVVFVPYPTSINILSNYDVIKDGFVHAARNYSNIIDTTQVGFLGYSFGGGASYSIAQEMLTNGWGTQSNFISSVAAWYAFNLSDADLASYPTNTHLLSFVLDSDDVCDQRMSLEIFENSNISDAQKDVVFVPGSEVSGYTYYADHYSFLDTSILAYDAIDVYVFHRLLGALTAYLFDGDASAAQVALGNGSPLQVDLPTGMNDLLAGDDIFPSQPQSYYQWKCDTFLNQRSSHCDDVTGLDVSKTANDPSLFRYYFIGGVHSIISDKIVKGAKATVYDLYGRKISEQSLNNTKVDISIPSDGGMYILNVGEQSWKILAI